MQSNKYNNLIKKSRINIIIKQEKHDTTYKKKSNKQYIKIKLYIDLKNWLDFERLYVTLFWRCNKMGYYDTLLGGAIRMDQDIKINNVAMPEPSEPVKITFNNVSDGGRLADDIDYEGSLKGVKVNIELRYAVLDKEHYDILFNNTQKRYVDGLGFFMSITVPTYTPLGVQTYTGYFNSTHEVNCVDTTEKHGNNSSYWRGGANYDELHRDVVFKFVQQ
jgi:hypothetical protein